MISRNNIKKFCCEDISKIENYEIAVNSSERYDCHHRLEIQEDGTVTSMNKLKELNLYYNRPASELIFLLSSEHSGLHASHRNPESNAKIAEYMRNRIISEETKFRISESVKKYQKENPITEEQHEKMSYMQQNMKFFNNGKISTKALKCPEGFIPGRLKYHNNGNKGMHWYNNGIEQICCLEKDCPEGFVLGLLPRSEEHKKHISEGRKKALQNSEYRKKLSEANKGQKRYTNGIVNITLGKDEPCPEGFWRGVIRCDSKKNKI